MKTSIATLFCVIASLLTSQAGTLINTNLPAGTSIVNIDARADGAAAFTGNQSFFFQPINGVDLLLQPGIYSFRIINPADASTLYPNLTAGQLGSIYTAWTFNSPWIENYFAFNATARSNPNEFQLFDGAAEPGNASYSSAANAYNGVKASGYFDNIRLAPPGRAGTLPADFIETFTVTVPTTLVFVVPDNFLSDNSGGVSVVVNVVPEPAVGGSLLFGATLLAVIRRTRRTTAF